MKKFTILAIISGFLLVSCSTQKSMVQDDVYDNSVKDAPVAEAPKNYEEDLYTEDYFDPEYNNLADGQGNTYINNYYANAPVGYYGNSWNQNCWSCSPTF